MTYTASPQAYTVEFTAAQIFGFADLVRRLGQAYGPDAGRSLRQDLVDALNAFVNLLPEPSDEDGDAYLAAMRAGELPNWGMDGQPLTETAEEWAARVRAQLAAETVQDEEADPAAVMPPGPEGRLAVPQPAVSPEALSSRSFAGLPESVSAARSWVAGFFPDPATAADAALMTSELFTNAVQYSASRLPGGQVTVSARTGGGSVRVDVVDQGEVPPCFPPHRGLGLGLGLVAALADDCGADGRDRWFALGSAVISSQGGAS
jgi:anti-sigma regulatory factor (Ser/Thr protein kinase)